MFLLNEFLLLSPLVVYTFVRVLLLFRRAAPRIVFAASFVLLVAAFPLAETLSHHEGGEAPRAAILIGYDALPFLMYFALTVVLSDIFISAGRLVGLISRETVRSSGFRSLRLGVAFAVPALAVAAGIVNFHRLRINEYRIDVPRRGSALPGLTIVFAVPGNHEGHGVGGRGFFERAGIRLLEDTVVKIDETVYLVGRKDARSRDRKPVADLLRDVPGDLPVILLDHRPTGLEAVSRTDVDIQLLGHTHYGQLFPINWITDREYELSWGHLKKGRTHVFVTSGVQLWGPPVRAAGDSEILVIRVNFTGQAKIC